MFNEYAFTLEGNPVHGPLRSAKFRETPGESDGAP